MVLYYREVIEDDRLIVIPSYGKLIKSKMCNILNIMSLLFNNIANISILVNLFFFMYYSIVFIIMLFLSNLWHKNFLW